MIIRIIATPPGFTPEIVRQQWVGIQIPVVEDGDPQGSLWTGQQNASGYVVNTADAIKALRDAGKEEAAQFWEVIQDSIGNKLRFKKECCEVV